MCTVKWLSYIYLYRYIYLSIYLYRYTYRYIYGAQLISHVQFFETSWAAVCQGPLSMEFSRQEYPSGLLFPKELDMTEWLNNNNNEQRVCVYGFFFGFFSFKAV